MIETGKQFPPQGHIERLARYQRGKTIFDGKPYEMFDRAAALLKDTPAAPQLKTLYIACNIVDVLLTKPSDLLVGEPPTFESGRHDDSPEQEALNSIVEENDLTARIHESVIGAGYRGDAFFKVRYGYAQDFSAIPEGLVPPDAKQESIIEPVDASIVFPELARGSKKKFKAVNIAWVEWVERPNGFLMSRFSREKMDAEPFLNVERHVPGYIIYERYKLQPNGIDTQYGAPVELFRIGEKIETGREVDIVETGVARPLVFHIPYKSVDDRWYGISGIEKIESLLAAINDRIVQIDYILWKHSDPTAYGPDDVEEEDGASVRFGGKYIPTTKDDVTPGYMTWNSQLEGAFKELDYLLGMVFQMSETPQWLFGTTVTADRGGTGTSHTDSQAIKSRMMPILSKVTRIRTHVERAIRDAVWTAMELENFANREVKDFVPYEPVYPTIIWADGLPKDDKELAEIAQIRTGGKPTLDVHTAIKRLDGLDDSHAAAIMTRITQDEKDAYGTVDSTVFNEVEVIE
ncbi:phage portal protein [Paenibacillus alvei]|uniref:phage portal protein n=1 Tax=Paenibacillus alvei TaxID=44250 RepID=UPI0018CC7F66|nr:phage portal protein [Paenibacillus alvei]MCY9582494.1 phage portal protein [Paenibacillus alvei]MCY9587370.1 phage portal protein [Paenibacillus alvei]